MFRFFMQENRRMHIIIQNKIGSTFRYILMIALYYICFFTLDVSTAPIGMGAHRGIMG